MRFGFWSVACACVLECAGLVALLAAATPPQPAAAACAVPNADAKLLNGVPPKTPLLDDGSIVTGIVVVRITLDETSRVTAASIERSPAAVLNAPAIAAARAATFQTTVKDCVPVGGSFRYIVFFKPPTTGSPPVMALKFLGKWSCDRDDGAAAEVTYSTEGSALEAVSTAPNAQRADRFEFLDRPPLTLTMYVPELRYVAKATDSSGNRITFSGTSYSGSSDFGATFITVTYNVLDANHYERTIATGADPHVLDTSHTERCERLPNETR